MRNALIDAACPDAGPETGPGCVGRPGGLLPRRQKIAYGLPSVTSGVLADSKSQLQLGRPAVLSEQVLKDIRRPQMEAAGS